ncbi:hypothetical protein BJ878DRAFT_477793 [Calycina marina]|uniref:Uncharacterized protein n=1 Tax=Calycina marina TaxID=1763456 RepID=A0A9P8CH70_9HELO|nr:hypothetical protein BJ878DRAFT_477793 [Calycina marina]
MVPREHEWSPFETQLLLALMSRGVHRPPGFHKNDDSRQLRATAHFETASQLNDALNGEGRAFGRDVNEREVSRMIDRLLEEKKGVLGHGGIMERQRVPRITRTIRMAFERHKKLDFDGSEREWEEWRKYEVMEKKRISAGGKPRIGTLEEPGPAVQEGADRRRVDSGVGLSRADDANERVDHWAQANNASPLNETDIDAPAPRLYPSIETDAAAEPRFASRS